MLEQLAVLATGSASAARCGELRLDAVDPQRLLGRALRDPAVRRRPRDDEVVALGHVERAEDRLDPRPPALDVDALVADPVAVPRAGSPGHGVRDAHVAVAEDEATAGDDVGVLHVLGVEQVVQLEVPRHQRVVGRRRQVADRPTRARRRRSRGCCGGRAARSRRRSPPPPSAPRSRARPACRGRPAGGAGCAAWAGCCPSPVVRHQVHLGRGLASVGPSVHDRPPSDTASSLHRHDHAVGCRRRPPGRAGAVRRPRRRRRRLPAGQRPLAEAVRAAPRPPREPVCRVRRVRCSSPPRRRSTSRPARRRQPLASGVIGRPGTPAAEVADAVGAAAPDPRRRGRRGRARLDAGLAGHATSAGSRSASRCRAARTR